METRPTLLLIEDDPTLSELLSVRLAEADFDVVAHSGIADAVAWLDTHVASAVVLDLTLPDGDGIELCRRIRARSKLPLIMISARGELADKERGLDVGADDYLAKPFDPAELVARLRALLRRWRDWQGAAPSRALAIDEMALLARVGSEPLPLTPIEFRLLRTLARHPGRAFSRSQLLDAIYSADKVVNDRTVDSHLKNLRRKLVEAGLDDPISAVYGVGYRFER